MFYVRRHGAFLPLASLLTSITVTAILRQYKELSTVALLLIGLGLFALVHCTIYLVNCVLVDQLGKREVDVALRTRWKQRLRARIEGRVRSQPLADYVDRVADIRIRLAKPAVVEGVLFDLVHAEREARSAAEETTKELLAKRDLCATVKLMANRWRSTEIPPARGPRLIDDPVHGCVALDAKLATILAHPLLQRLSRVRQLSFSYTQFPSSTHSRLSHCLGAARNIERALIAIFDERVFYKVGETSPRPFPDEVMQNRNQIIQKAKLVALLHDLGHGPFGHALDNYIGFSKVEKSNPDPDKLFTADYIKAYLAPTLSSLGFDPQELVRILDPEERFQLRGPDALIGELIDSALDVDRMDFLIRDAHMTGLSMGFTNADALIESLRPVLVEDGYTLGFDEGAIAYMEHFLYAREAMYRTCYEHPRKRAAERIFERLVKELAKDESWKGVEEDLYALTDEEILCAPRLSGLNSSLASGLLEQLLGDVEYVVVHDVWIQEPGSPAADWARRATKGRTGDPWLTYIEQPALWEKSIAVDSGIGLDRIGQIQVIVPSPSAYQQKFSSAQILRKRGGRFETEQLFKVAPHIGEVLKQMNPARARIKVMCANSFSSAERDRVKEAAAKQLGG